LAIKNDYNKRSEINQIYTLNIILKDCKVKKIIATQQRRRFYTINKWVKRAKYYKNIVRNLGPNYNKKDKDPILEKKDLSYSNQSKRRQKKKNY
jgi:hypothetical protein